MYETPVDAPANDNNTNNVLLIPVFGIVFEVVVLSAFLVVFSVFVDGVLSFVLVGFLSGSSAGSLFGSWSSTFVPVTWYASAS